MSHPDGPWSRLPPPPPSAPPQRRGFHLGPWLLCIALVVALIVVLDRLFPGQLSKPQTQADAVGAVLFAAVAAAAVLTRVRPAQGLRYLALWAGVILVLLLGYSFRGEGMNLFNRLRSELIPGAPVTSAPGEIMITRDVDGGFYVTGQVNRQAVRFLADTGASDIVLSPGDAQRLGVDLGSLTFGKPVETANGMGLGAAYTAATLQVGDLHLRDVPMSVNKAPMSASLLGMAFFNRLQSFRMEGNRLYLRAKG